MMEKNMYRFVNAFLLMACCLWGLGEKIGITDATLAHFTVGCVVLILLTAWCQLRLKGRIVLGGSTVVAIAVTIAVVGGDETVNHLKNYIQGIVGHSKGDLVWGHSQECMQVTIIALACFGVSFLVEQMFSFRVILSAVWIGVLAFDLFTNRNLAHMGVVCIFLYIVITYVEWIQKNWKKEKLGSGKHYMIRILPFLALYFMMMALMPAPQKPYEWKFVKEAYANVRETFLQISRNWLKGNREDFAFGTAGFSGSGSFFGSISDEEKTLMIIQGQASLKTNVYMVGKVYDIFDGDSWESLNEDSENDRQLDALETIYAVECYEPEGVDKYLNRTGLRIWYEEFRTSYLFTPLKTFYMQNIEDADYASVGGSYVFSKKQGYGLVYNTSYMQINVDHPVFYDFLEKEIPQDEELFKELQKEYLQNSTQYKLEDLENHHKQIQTTYGKSFELSPEIAAWLDRVTYGAESDIDKLKSIESALQQMTYTETPGEVPEEVDSEGEYLDYFLLESKQGYCVHYATAFTLLARAEGIPTRYVEGFCVPVSGTYKVPVTSKMAHAWPEVYIQGVGWIPFEPTPGYAEIRYTPWEISTDSTTTGNGASQTEGIGEAENEEEVTQEELVKEEDRLQQQNENNDSDKNLLKIIGWTIFFSLVSGVLILCIDILLRRSRMKGRGIEEKFIAEIEANMRILAFLGYERAENETLTELRQRAWAIMDKEDDDFKSEFMFLKLYEEYLYGQYPVKEEMLVTLAEEKQALLLLLKKWKPLLYWYCKIRV